MGLSSLNLCHKIGFFFFFPKCSLETWTSNTNNSEYHPTLKDGISDLKIVIMPRKANLNRQANWADHSNSSVRCLRRWDDDVAGVCKSQTCLWALSICFCFFFLSFFLSFCLYKAADGGDPLLLFLLIFHQRSPKCVSLGGNAQCRDRQTGPTRQDSLGSHRLKTGFGGFKSLFT